MSNVCAGDMGFAGGVWGGRPTLWLPRGELDAQQRVIADGGEVLVVVL